MHFDDRAMLGRYRWKAAKGSFLDNQKVGLEMEHGINKRERLLSKGERIEKKEKNKKREKKTGLKFI